MEVGPHTPAPPSDMLVTGHAIGGYTILSRLGAGGMGEVYRRRDTKLGREVAIKVLPENSPTIAIGWPAFNARRGFWPG